MSHLDRIAALLTKAERSDNQHEAEAYLAKAQALATQAKVISSCLLWLPAQPTPPERGRPV